MKKTILLTVLAVSVGAVLMAQPPRGQMPQGQRRGQMGPQRPAYVPEAGKQDVVLTIGDSNGSFSWSWPMQLRKLFDKYELINNSESGRTVGQTNLDRESLNGCLIIEGIMRDVDTKVGNRNLKYIIISLGTNDAKTVFADRTAEYKTHLEQFMDKIEASAVYRRCRPQILLVTPFPMDETHPQFVTEKYEGATERIRGFAQDMKAVAEARGYGFLDVFSPMTQDMIQYGTTDGVHLQPQLSAYVAGKINVALTPAAPRR